ncbi:hypothetical protein E4T39_02504 [Aureobasidium subglaciale]|nr:hypothetical protein E4T39_02504 [Aureobasidium subglaciale]
MAIQEKSDTKVATSDLQLSAFEIDSTPDVQPERRPLRYRFRGLIWDSWNRSPEERKFIHKIDFFILHLSSRCLLTISRTWAGLTYFSKNLNQNNLCTSELLALVHAKD